MYNVNWTKLYTQHSVNTELNIPSSTNREMAVRNTEWWWEVGGGGGEGRDLKNCLS